MMHPASHRAFAAGVALMGAALAVAPLRAQTPAVPPAPAPPVTPTLLPLTNTTPSPNTVRPIAFRAQRPTPPVIQAAAAGSPPPSTVAPAPAPAPTAATMPPALAAPVPQPMLASQAAAPAKKLNTGVAPPAGATGQCKDGTFLMGGAPAAQCVGRGGIQVVFPVNAVPVRGP